MNGFLLAWSFLTRVPTPLVDPVTPADLGRATRWYPLVGLAVGGVQIAALTVGSWTVSPFFGAVLCVAAGEWFTRGLHLDGFADCLDGLLVNGGPDPVAARARTLAVMKDPHVGGLGAAGVAIWVLLRVAAVQAAVAHAAVVPALLGGAVLSRALIATDVRQFPAASERGLYASLRGGVSTVDAAIAGAAGVLAAAWMVKADPARGALAVLLVVVVPAFWHRAWLKKLGGINGDVVGAAVQIRELLVWAFL